MPTRGILPVRANRLLRARRERPRDRRAPEQRDELAPLQLIESHRIPTSRGLDRSISQWICQLFNKPCDYG